MDRINELLGKGVENLSDTELAELQGLIRENADELAAEDPTDETVAALSELATASEQVTAETDKRAEAQATREAARDEALARIRPADSATDADEDGDNADTADAATDDDAGDNADTATDSTDAVAASAARTPARPALTRLANRVPNRNRPDQRQTEQTQRTSRTTITASGQTVESRREVAAAVSNTVVEMSRLSTGKRVAVHADVEFPTERRLGTDKVRNMNLVAAALGTPGDPAQALAQPSEALVAAGLCAPIENLYDVNVVGTSDRPIRDALAPFQADRGGVSLRPSPVFQDWGDGAGVWTLQDDEDNAAGGEDAPTKSIVEADCIGFEDFYVDGVYQRVGFRNITARFDPEGTQANLEVLDIAHARFAENRLLTKLAAASISVTSAKVVGATRDLLATADRAVAYYRNRHRLADNSPFRYIAPRWVKDMIRADLTRGAQDFDALAAADAQIAEWFARRAIRPTWHLDGRPTAQAAVTGPPVVVGIAAQQYAAAVSGSAIPEFPDTIEQLLFPEGDFLFLDGGQLDLGVVRDTATNANNRYELFKESFEGVAHRGYESLQIVSTVDPNGLRAGSIDTSAISD